MIITALLIGLAGSLHCLGMCSPLIMAATAKKPFITQKIVYNVGRIVTYGVLGSITATVGTIIHFSVYQQVLSFLMGSILLLIAFGGLSGIKIPIVSAGIIQFTSWLKREFGSFLQHKGSFSSIMLGMLNGLLPCGLTYLAMMYCLSLDSWWEGFVFMFFFGLGTWPVMLGIPGLLGISSGFLSRNLSRVTTLLLVVSGCLLIGRSVFSHNHIENRKSQIEGTEVLCR
ncbi:MAG: sulfite exporter TauE/SafE family protein [Bacteroidota bacterium]